MKDGIIKLDTKFARELGFTSDKFNHNSYLWKSGNDIWISFIWSAKPRQGNLSKLFDRIMTKGFNIKVPTPFGKMQSILEKKGFKHTIEQGENGQCDVWINEISKNRIDKLQFMDLGDKKWVDW